MDDRLTVAWRCCSCLPSTFSLRQKAKYMLFSDHEEMRFEITSMNPLSNTYLSSFSMELLDDGKGAYHDNRQLFILRTPISRHDHIDCQTLACNMLVNALSKKKVLSIHPSLSSHQSYQIKRKKTSLTILTLQRDANHTLQGIYRFFGNLRWEGWYTQGLLCACGSKCRCEMVSSVEFDRLG